MPTLLQVYSLHQTNKLVTTTIEYAVKQFYLMNRKPFILQMFGSVSAILDTDEEGTYGEAHKVELCGINVWLKMHSNTFELYLGAIELLVQFVAEFGNTITGSIEYRRTG